MKRWIMLYLANGVGWAYGAGLMITDGNIPAACVFGWVSVACLFGANFFVTHLPSDD